jgi:hypothetical protein
MPSVPNTATASASAAAQNPAITIPERVILAALQRASGRPCRVAIIRGDTGHVAQSVERVQVIHDGRASETLARHQSALRHAGLLDTPRINLDRFWRATSDSKARAVRGPAISG